MRQTRKGKQWHFGMKAHIGCDKRGIVHSLATTDAAASDIGQLPKLLHGKEKEIFGDQAYWSEFHRQCAKGSKIRYRVNRRGTSSRPLTEYQKFINRCRSSSRARGEHAFHVVKRLWGFAKVRYRGLAKNTARLYTAFALANLYRSLALGDAVFDELSGRGVAMALREGSTYAKDQVRRALKELSRPGSGHS